MPYLIAVSVIWAFSFGLIKGQLTGLDSNFVAATRMLLALVVFLPFLRLRGVKAKFALQLLLLGGLQFGLMYVFYIRAYQYLPAYQIALMTIFTPLYITLFNNLIQGSFTARFHLSALLSIAGAAVIVYADFSDGLAWFGVLIIQLSNIAFGVGQLLYKRLMANHTEIKDQNVFAIMYVGGLAVTLLAATFTFDANVFEISGQQILALLYLGLLASGLCFFMWNRGATQVNVGTLAVFNNGYIPLAVVFSILFFGESADLFKLSIGTVLILLAIVINEKTPAEASA